MAAISLKAIRPKGIQHKVIPLRAIRRKPIRRKAADTRVVNRAKSKAAPGSKPWCGFLLYGCRAEEVKTSSEIPRGLVDSVGGFLCVDQSKSIRNGKSKSVFVLENPMQIRSVARYASNVCAR